MRIARACAPRPVVFSEEADGKARSTITTLRSAGLGNRALRLAQFSIARQPLHAVHFLPGDRWQEYQATVDGAIPAGGAIGCDKGHGASTALTLGTALL